ncbi:MAG: hypothetical protein U9Q62_01025 [Campylobacterota bacterium]|nr:hypothetical protein [Campylobacterota bacterium]
MSEIVETTNLFLEQLKSFNKTSENSFILEHGDICKKELIYKSIKENVSKKSGIYIYYLEDTNKVIYVGKAKSLYSRIKCHYDESIFIANGEKLGIAGDSKKGMYPAFFNKKLKGDNSTYNVTIVWIEVNDEFKRRLIEDAFHLVLEPTFINFQKTYNKN